MRRLGVGLAAVLALIAPATARADWSAPQQVSHVLPQLEAPRLAFDGRSGAFAAWDESSPRNLFGAKLVPPGTFVKSQVVGNDVVVDDMSASRDGSVLLLATGRNGRGGRIETYVRTPGGRFRPSQVLDRIPRPYAYIHHALLGGDPAGDAVVVWSRARRKHPTSPLFMAVRHRGGRFGRARVIAKNGVTAYALAMNAAGQFVVAWERGTHVEARLGRGNALGPVHKLGVPDKGLPPALTAAMDGGGNALVAWLGKTNIELAYHHHGFGFDAPRGLPHEATAGFGAHMALTFASREHAVLALDGSDSDGPGIFAFDVFRGAPSPAVRLSPPTPVGTPPPQPAVQPFAPRLQDLAAGPGGQVAVAWAVARNDQGYTGTGDLIVSHRAGGGTFSPPEQVSGPSAPLPDTSGFPVSTIRFDPASGKLVALWVADLSLQRRLPPGQVIETSSRR